MSDLKDIFKDASDTGQQVLLLKADKVCSCVTTEGIYAGEADPHCHICYGTGKTRFPILTEKIRFEHFKRTATEYQDFERIKANKIIFYFPANYQHIDYQDIIVILGHDNKNNLIKPLKKEIFMKVIDDREKFKDDFIYKRVIAEKIKYLD